MMKNFSFVQTTNLMTKIWLKMVTIKNIVSKKFLQTAPQVPRHFKKYLQKAYYN